MSQGLFRRKTDVPTSIAHVLCHSSVCLVLRVFFGCKVKAPNLWLVCVILRTSRQALSRACPFMHPCPLSSSTQRWRCKLPPMMFVVCTRGDQHSFLHLEVLTRPTQTCLQQTHPYGTVTEGVVESTVAVHVEEQQNTESCSLKELHILSVDVKQREVIVLRTNRNLHVRSML